MNKHFEICKDCPSFNDGDVLGHRPVFEKHYAKNIRFNEGTQIVICPKVGIFFTREIMDAPSGQCHESKAVSVYILKDDEIENRIKDMEFFYGERCLFKHKHDALADMP